MKEQILAGCQTSVTGKDHVEGTIQLVLDDGAQPSIRRGRPRGAHMTHILCSWLLNEKDDIISGGV